MLNSIGGGNIKRRGGGGEKEMQEEGKGIEGTSLISRGVCLC